VAAVTGDEAAVRVAVEQLASFAGTDLEDLCQATEAAITEGGGFGWVKPPRRDILEKYWQGVMLVPGRSLFIGRIDGIIAGSAQLIRQPRNNEAQAFSAQLMSAFVAPWARGRGLGRGLVAAAEEVARRNGVEILNLDIRDTQTAAIRLYERAGYIRWGTHPEYAMVEGKVYPGHYYYKRLETDLSGGPTASDLRRGAYRR
jgi:ribosomal protein S18 acetylase RimI-like enzyme